jgi:hypothetical protein
MPDDASRRTANIMEELGGPERPHCIFRNELGVFKLKRDSIVLFPMVRGASSVLSDYFLEPYYGRAFWTSDQARRELDCRGDRRHPVTEATPLSVLS